MLLLLCCGFVASPNRVEAQTQAAGGPQIAANANAAARSQTLATIPFEMYFNEIFVQVRVNNSEPMWFVVDSGAGGWIVDRAHATRLGLHLEQETAQGTGAGSGTYDVSYVKDVSFTLLGFNIAVPLIGVIDLSAHKSQIGREVEGLVGYDFFEKFVVEIDYGSRVIRLFDPATYHYSGVGESIPIMVDQLSLIHICVVGQNPQGQESSRHGAPRGRASASSQPIFSRALLSSDARQTGCPKGHHGNGTQTSPHHLSHGDNWPSL